MAVAALIVLLLLFCILSGCATVYPECKKYPKGSEVRKKCNSDVREWREEIDKINWSLCMQLYVESGTISIHREHRHGQGRDKATGTQPFDIRRDLNDNNCRIILREHWADY